MAHCKPSHAWAPSIHVTFEACSGFTRVTARQIAQPPKATFVARLQPARLPDRAARQLPDLSTILRVEPSSTDDSRLQGAPPATARTAWPFLDPRRPQATRIGCDAPIARMPPARSSDSLFPHRRRGFE